jgi:myo-inositol-1(or 4)-monophosphatase
MALSPHMNVMIKAVEKAARSLIRDFGEVEQLQVSRKGPGDFVSAADHRSEEIIFTELSTARPDYAFLMEERGSGGKSDAEYRWIVDPLDGTTNFLHGIPHWNITIALEHKGEIIAGVIHDPVRHETFRAEKGLGAFMKNKRLRVSGRTSLEQAVIFTGAPRRAREQQDLFMREYEAVQTVCPGMRRFGSAALDLAYVAAGRCEAFWERNLNPWDVAAGTIIIKEAGGLVADISSSENPVRTGHIIAGNAALFADLKKLLNDAGRGKNAA